MATAAAAVPFTVAYAQSSPGTFRPADSEARPYAAAEIRASRSESDLTEIHKLEIQQEARHLAAWKLQVAAAERAREAAAAQAQASRSARRSAVTADHPVYVTSDCPPAPANMRQLGRQIMAAYFTASQWAYLDQLWSRESEWNPYCENPSSGAYGIPQALPGSRMGVGWRDDPAAQIRWGCQYILQRYGTPESAWAHELAYGFY